MSGGFQQKAAKILQFSGKTYHIPLYLKKQGRIVQTPLLHRELPAAHRA